MTVRFGFYPGGKRRALTLSYDDGLIYDLRLLSLLRENDLHGTFHLNAASIDTPEHIASGDIAAYAGQEIASHTLNHVFPEKVPAAELIHQSLADREILEQLCGYPVRGLSYPYGAYDGDSIALLRSLGTVYSRTTVSTGNFELPRDFMTWHPTCHHNADITSRLEAFRTARPLALYDIWGHSYEFERQNTWEMIRDFCARAAHIPDCWYATNIQIYDYITALRSVVFTVDRTVAYNPTATDVVLDVDGEPVTVKAGETVKLR